MGFSENLHNELEYQDIQIKELSKRTGISKNTIDKYLSGKKSQPNVQNAVIIAKALNVSVEYLVNGYNESEKNDSLNKRELISIFDSLSEQQQEAFLNLAKVFIKSINI